MTTPPATRHEHVIWRQVPPLHGQCWTKGLYRSFLKDCVTHCAWLEVGGWKGILLKLAAQRGGGTGGQSIAEQLQLPVCLKYVSIWQLGYGHSLLLGWRIPRGGSLEAMARALNLAQRWIAGTVCAVELAGEMSELPGFCFSWNHFTLFAPSPQCLVPLAAPVAARNWESIC